ncbi:CsbD family protein [Acidisoma sp. 7E03]
MDENRIKGEAHRLKGSIKEAIGKVTGDRKMEAEGAVEKQAGKAQAAAGRAADGVRDAVGRAADKVKDAVRR